MNKAKILETAPRFYVDDVEKTLLYYINQLGFTLINKVPNTYAMVQRDGLQLHFAKFNTLYPNKHQPQHLIIWIPEIDLFWEELKSKDIKIIEPIVLRPYGNREFVFEDCNGNIITICD